MQGFILSTINSQLSTRSMATSRVIPCPICKKPGPWQDGLAFPFCSERCKMVDLGKWLGEEHRIASPLTIEDLEELADSEENQSDR